MAHGLNVEPYPLWLREQRTSDRVQGEAVDNGPLASWCAHGGYLCCASGWETLKPYEQREVNHTQGSSKESLLLATACSPNG